MQFHLTALFNGQASFHECILFCTGALRELGHEVSYADNQLRDDAINIVLGSHSDLSDNANWTALSKQAKDIIIYNWEQVADDVPFFTPRYIRQMVHTHVWDYNANNVAALKRAGVQDIHHLPMSYTPLMTSIRSENTQDIDVLFYGVVNERRKKILQSIRAMGLNVVSTEECPWMMGDERDRYIARSKVVLNMHYFDTAKIFEVARVSYLLANHKAVVSEVAHGTDIDPDLLHAINHGSAEELPQLCWNLVHNESQCKKLEQKGFDVFSQRNAKKVMQQAVERYLAQRATQNIGNLQDTSTPLPSTLNLGAGEQWRYDCCNLDARAEYAPDLVLDLSQPLPFDQVLPSWRYGSSFLKKNYFQTIIAKNVFQRVDDFKMALTNCLDLLQEGGTLEITVPLDFSYDAWMHIDDKRAFNDKSWEKIMDNWWQYGWHSHRFELINTGFGIHTKHGMAVLAEHHHDWTSALRVPRVVDFIQVILRKCALTEEDRKKLPAVRFLD